MERNMVQFLRVKPKQDFGWTILLVVEYSSPTNTLFYYSCCTIFFLENENFIDFKHNTAVALIPDLQSFGGRLQPAVDS